MSSKDSSKSSYSRSTSTGSMSATVYQPAWNLLPPTPDLASVNNRGFDFSKKSSSPPYRQNSAPGKGY